MSGIETLIGVMEVVTGGSRRPTTIMRATNILWDVRGFVQQLVERYLRRYRVQP